MVENIHIENFNKKILKLDNGCWQWQGMKDKDGYGKIKVNNKRTSAHRLAMIIAHGSIEENKWVLHKCDNPACVNPDHLYFGNPSQNSMDRENRKRGRPLQGENNGANKLNNLSVLKIRELLKTAKGKEIADMFGVTPGLVSYIKSRKIWGHI